MEDLWGMHNKVPFEHGAVAGAGSEPDDHTHNQQHNQKRQHHRIAANCVKCLEILKLRAPVLFVGADVGINECQIEFLTCAANNQSVHIFIKI